MSWRRAVVCGVCCALTAGALEAAPGITGVRFSLYPRVRAGGSLKAAVKSAVNGLGELGLAVTTDDVSSCLIGSNCTRRPLFFLGKTCHFSKVRWSYAAGDEPALFEAMRCAFGRAAAFDGETHVSMQCTFSAGCPGDVSDDAEGSPKRASHLPPPGEWVPDAFALPRRVACQFAVYPIGGGADDAQTIVDVLLLAQQSQAYVERNTPFCTMLDGDGAEVFDVLRASFQLARARAGPVVMTATLTANKSSWKHDDNDESESGGVTAPVEPESGSVAAVVKDYESYAEVLADLDIWM